MQLIRHVTLCFRQQSGHARVVRQCQQPTRLLVARRQAYASRVGDKIQYVGQSDSDVYTADSTTVRGAPRISYVCPACCQRIHRLSILQRHLQNCCPDLVSSKASQGTDDLCASLYLAIPASMLAARSAPTVVAYTQAWKTTYDDRQAIALLLDAAAAAELALRQTLVRSQ